MIQQAKREMHDDEAPESNKKGRVPNPGRETCNSFTKPSKGDFFGLVLLSLFFGGLWGRLFGRLAPADAWSWSKPKEGLSIAVQERKS